MRNGHVPAPHTYPVSPSWRLLRSSPGVPRRGSKGVGAGRLREELAARGSSLWTVRFRLRCLSHRLLRVYYEPDYTAADGLRQDMAPGGVPVSGDWLKQRQKYIYFFMKTGFLKK